jgi:hypothetical protein
VLELLGVDAPTVYNDVPQLPIHGTSLAYTLDDDAAPTRKQVQYYEILGNRAIWHRGWKAVARHESGADFDQDRWELYHLDEDYAESRDLAAEHPEKLRELIERWWVEAGKYDVLPLDDRSVAELVAAQPEAMIPPGGVYRYYPGTLEVPEFSAANTRGRSYKILAQVEIDDGDVEGVIYAQGARFGGHSLFVKDRRLWYAYNFVGLPPEQQLVSDREIEPGNHVLGVQFSKQSLGERQETHGTATLYLDDEVVAEAALRTQPDHFALCGEGLPIGRDSGDPVSKEYGAGFPFTGGKINEVEVNIGDDVYLDVEREFAAALARD